MTGDNDGAGADKAQSGDDLGGKSGHVRRKVHHQVNIVAGERSGRRADDDQDVGAETGRPVLGGALDADQASAEDRQDHAEKNSNCIDVTKTVKC